MVVRPVILRVVRFEIIHEMNYRWLGRLLILQAVATLAMGYALLGQSVAGIDPVYIVGIVLLVLFLGTVSYYAYKGYRASRSSNLDSKP